MHCQLNRPLFPMFVDIKNKKCLVFGAGRVALRKIKTLLLFGADVHVYAFDYHEEIVHLISQGKVTKDVAAVHFSDECLPPILDAEMVICATDNEVFNHKMAKHCMAMGIDVNSATSKNDCTFVFPAVVVRGDLVVGVTTSGNVPALTKTVREEIDEALPQWYADFIIELEKARKKVKKYVGNQTDRQQIIGALAEYGFGHQGKIPDNIVETLIHRYVDQM